MAPQNPVIVIPGITATSLVDDYPLKVDEIWTMVFNKEYERVALHPDDMRYEAVEPAPRCVSGDRQLQGDRPEGVALCAHSTC